MNKRRIEKRRDESNLKKNLGEEDLESCVVLKGGMGEEEERREDEEEREKRKNR